MDVLFFILRKKWKNRLRMLTKSKGALAGTLMMAFLLIFVLFNSFRNSAAAGGDFRNVNEVYGIILVLYTFIMLMSIYAGLKNGSAMFSMADVNLLFVSPSSPKKILFYGLIQQMGTSLLVAFYLLFQYSWVSQTYGISIVFMLYFILGFSIVLFVSNFIAMLIYMLTCHNEAAKLKVKSVILVICTLEIVYILSFVLKGSSNTLDTITSLVHHLPVQLFPVTGWMTAAIIAMQAGSFLKAGLILLGILLFIGLLILYVYRSHPDYYEDVLASAEVSFNTITAQKEGAVKEVTRANIKIGREGIKKGWGAGVIYYKQLLEARRGRIFIFDTMTSIFMILTLGFAFFLRSEGAVPALAMGAYFQLFTISSGRWVRELNLPYIYLIPEPPFNKLIACLGQGLQVYALEAVIVGIGIGLITGEGPLMLILCVVFRFSFSILFTAGNLLVQRFYSRLVIKWIIMLLYIVTMMLLAVPGLIAGGLTFLMSSSLPAVPLFFSAEITVNVLLALLLTFICRNVLSHAELNNT